MTVPIPFTKATNLENLLQYQDRQFVAHAYYALLNRQPDPPGLTYYVQRLRSGTPKLQILSEIFASPEANKTQAHLPGLRQAIRRQRLTRLPLVGALLRVIVRVDGHSMIENRLRIIEQQTFSLGQRTETGLAELNRAMQRLTKLVEDRNEGGNSQGAINVQESAGFFKRPVTPASPQALPSILRKSIVFDQSLPRDVIKRLTEAVVTSREARRLSTKH
jgi:hypothetical protein